MKRLFVFSALAVVMSLWAVSCSKEQDIIESNPEKEAVNEDSQAKEGTVLTFTVSTEYEETKTTWDGSDVIWVDEETVKIMYGNDNADKATGTIHVNGETGDVTLSFTVPDGHNEDETFYAVSPASATASLDNGTLTVTIPEEQNGSFASANIMAAKVEGGSGNISFKALSHVMKFSLSADNVYDRFKFTANKNSSVNLVGTVSTNFSKTGDNLNVTTDATGKYVDVRGLATGSAQTYYFAVVPGQNLSKGIAFKAHKNGETADTWQVGSYSTTIYGSADRLQIADIKTLDTQWIRTKWFIKTDGGDTGGASWDKAGNVKRLVNLLAPASADVDPEPASWKLFGADIYVASGTYDLQTAKGGVLQPNWGDNNITTIHGGYDADTKTSGTDVTGQDVDSYATNFVNKEDANNDRIFRFQDKVIYNLSFDGITFTTKGGSNHNSRGQVMYVDGTSAGTINFNNCRFKDMESSNGYGAPCFDFNASGELNVNFIRCKFTNNSCTNNTTYGGAVLLENGASTKLSFENCDFSDNTATGSKGGGALYINAGSVIIDGTAFTDNSAAGRGGAIYIAGGTTTIKGGTFSGNTAAGAGGAICIYQEASSTYVPVSLYNTAIVNNAATSSIGGGVYSVGKNDLIMVNCTVSGNSANNGGGIYVTRYNSNSSYMTRLSLISCTVTGNTASNGCGGIYKDTYGQVVDVYNSIISGNTGTNTDDDVRNAQLLYHVTKSIVASVSYASADRVNNNAPVGNFQWRTSTPSSPSDFNLATMLSDLSNKNVHCVNNVDNNPAKQCGMTSEELKGITLSYTPTQTLNTSFLTVDQKGNSRNGTIMGAYVLTE